MNTQQNALINSNKELMNKDLSIILNLSKKIEKMNSSELGNYIKRIYDFRNEYNIKDVDFLKPFQKENKEFLEICKLIVSVLNQREMYANYILNQLREKELVIKLTPNVIPRIYVNSYGYKFVGNTKKFEFKRLQSMGLHPNEDLLSKISGKLNYELLP